MDYAVTPYELPEKITVETFVQLRKGVKAGDRRAQLTLDAIAAQRKADVDAERAASVRKDGTIADAMKAARERREKETR